MTRHRVRMRPSSLFVGTAPSNSALGWSRPPLLAFLLFKNSKAVGDFDTKAVSKIDQTWRIFTRRRSVKSTSAAGPPLWRASPPNFTSCCQVCQILERLVLGRFEASFLQLNMRATTVAAFVKLYSVCTLLHCFNLSFFQEFICLKGLKTLRFWLMFMENCKCCKIFKFEN